MQRESALYKLGCNSDRNIALYTYMYELGIIYDKVNICIDLHPSIGQWLLTAELIQAACSNCKAKPTKKLIKPSRGFRCHILAHHRT